MVTEKEPNEIPTFEEFNNPESWTKLQSLMGHAGKQKMPSVTQLWYYWCATSGDIKNKPRKLAGHEIFYRTLPLEKMTVEGIDPSRVLIVGAKAETRKLGRCESRPSSDILKIFAEQNLDDSVKVTWSWKMEHFWTDFFAEQDFIGTPVHLPRLIVTTGNIHSHPNSKGSASTVLSKLLEFANIWNSKKWRIPVIAIPVPVSAAA